MESHRIRTQVPRVLGASSAIVFVLLLGAHLYGACRWGSSTRRLRARLDASREPVRPRTVDFRELEGSPAPVGRYFRAVLEDGQPMVSGACMRHTGTFNMGEGDQDNWKLFTSDQQVVTHRPGFNWNGRVAMMPGLPVRVHDAYVAGEGVLHASLLGLFTVVEMRGNGDVAEGELMRFFVEAAWYPTALLPSQGVRWEAAGDNSAYATLKDGDISITMLFTFDERGLIETVSAEADGGRRDNSDAMAGSVLELPGARRHAGTARRRGGLAIARGREAPLARPHSRDLLRVRAVIRRPADAPSAPAHRIILHT